MPYTRDMENTDTLPKNFEVINSFETDNGIRYELHALAADHKYAARIEVIDTDAAEVLGITFYPALVHAQAKFAEAQNIVIAADTFPASVMTV